MILTRLLRRNARSRSIDIPLIAFEIWKKNKCKWERRASPAGGSWGTDPEPAGAKRRWSVTGLVPFFSTQLIRLSCLLLCSLDSFFFSNFPAPRRSTAWQGRVCAWLLTEVEAAGRCHPFSPFVFQKRTTAAFNKHVIRRKTAGGCVPDGTGAASPRTGARLQMAHYSSIWLCILLGIFIPDA